MSEQNPNKEKSPGYVAGMSEEELRLKYNVAEIVKIGSNENPLGPSPRAVEAMQQAVPRLHRYPPMTDERLRGAIAASLGNGVTPDHVVTGNGACDVLSMIADGFLGADDECVICRPTFPVYEFLAKRNGATVVHADLDDRDFAFNVESILHQLGERTRIVFLCSPNNPTGTLLRDGDLQRIVDALPAGAIIVFDEVYYHFITEPERPNALARVIDGRPIIITHSFSKAYGLAGCRLGYGIAPPEIIREVSRYRVPFHINNVTTEAGLAALKDSDHLDATVATVVDGRRWLGEALAQLGVETWPSQGNFVLFRTKHPALAISEELQKRGVIVRPMNMFYLPDHLRVSVGREEDNQRFVEALADAMSTIAD
jgi:histidinol-phosphate aminotransferase